MTKRLTEDEHRLAEAAARAITIAEEIGLPDGPDKIVTSPTALRVLARGYLELRDQHEAIFAKIDRALVLPLDQRALHAALSQKLDGLKFAGTVAVRLQNIFENIGLTYLGELVQLDKRTLLRQKHCGKTSLRAIDAMLAAQGLRLGCDLDDWPGPRWRCTSASPFCEKVRPGFVERLVETPAPAPTTAQSDTDPWIAVYCRLMGDPIEAFLGHEKYIVRQWDGMDGCWTDCTGDVDRAEALRVWAERTSGGTKHVAYEKIDYYRIFPGGTRMIWDGSDGREMHR